ncbi:MAG: hypothetical protein AB7E47_07590 [Desulfovibrionaceae bacterium]
MSWHLRLGKQDVLKALVGTKTVRQLENALLMEPQWRMETLDRGDHIEAVFTLKQPRPARP